MYVIDTSVISALHKNYFRPNFPSLWEQFDKLIDLGQITSVKEVLRELEGLGGSAYEWAKHHSELFPGTNAAEGKFVVTIFAVKHFQSNISNQKTLKGGLNADPFLIARAAVLKASVLTIEKLKPQASKIPNICQHFKVPCYDLAQFMDKEDWKF
jgi:Domain of unknown function (DUF4411)